jgi:hypothetical protein
MTNIWHSNIPGRHPALFEYFQLPTFAKIFSLLHTTSVSFFCLPIDSRMCGIFKRWRGYTRYMLADCIVSVFDKCMYTDCLAQEQEWKDRILFFLLEWSETKLFVCLINYVIVTVGSEVAKISVYGLNIRSEGEWQVTFAQNKITLHICPDGKPTDSIGMSNFRDLISDWNFKQQKALVLLQ